MPSRNGRKYVARITDLDDGALECHAYGHAWAAQVPTEAYDAKYDAVVYVQKLECVRCPKVRTDTYARYSHVRTGRPHYTEPDRYRVLEPVARGRKAYQREALNRALSRARSAQRDKRFRPV
jgi:hypothetical protein